MAVTVPAPDIAAVVFDMGGVFFLPDHKRVAEGLRRVGLDPPTEVATYHRAHYTGMKAYDTSENAPETWDAYLAGYLTGLGIDDGVMAGATAAAREVWSVPANEHWTWHQADAAVGLAALAGMGFGLAVVSNCDGTAARCLAQFDVCQIGGGPGVAVAAIVDSGEVGLEKPDPRIFEPAIDALDVEPEACVYLGDAVRNDVQGSRAAGMWPVHLDPYDLHPDADHDRIASVAELVEHLS